MDSSADNTVDRIRAFNRFYSKQMDLLGRSYLDSGFTLSEVRALHDLAAGDGPTARDLASALALDEGYLSRILKRFRARGWIERHPDPGDARRGRLRLTPAGLAGLTPLRARARDRIEAQIGHLAGPERDALTAAMARIETILAGRAAPVVLRDLEPGDAGWVIGRHGALYARDEGYDHRFEALVARIVADILSFEHPDQGRGWITDQGGQRVGSVFCVRETADTARLRLFLIEPEARGQGLGRRMLAAAMDWARARGHRRMTLWTHESHRAACALYARAGFRLTASEPGQAFGQSVVDQTWDIDL